MENPIYDVVIIGAGPGGYVAAIRAAQLGLKTACIDKGETLGGTCLNVGCIPSKALLQSSEHYEWIKKSSSDQGIYAKDLSFDLDAMMHRKGAIIKGLVDGIAAHFKKHGITRYQGTARFIDPHRIQVNSEVIQAKNILIATGSESIGLPFLPFDEQVVLSSTGALDLKKVPKKLLVIGAGVIGLELASVYRRLGSEVAIIEMLNTVTPSLDKALGRALQQTLTKQGMQFYLSAKVKAGSSTKSGVTLDVEYEGKEQKMSGDCVLVAVGRKPYTKDLNLEAAGVRISPKGFIEVDSAFRTMQPHILAVGDVIEGPMLAHRASHEALCAIESIVGNKVEVNYLAIPNVIYTHPEVAAVGLTEDEVKAAGLNPLVGTSFFRGNARARCNGDLEGFVKVVGDAASKRVLGVHIIGAQASEMIGEGMLAIEKSATLADIADAPHAHPTLSETIMEAAQQALGRAIHG